MIEAEMDEHLGYEKTSVPCDRNGEFEPEIIEKRHTRTDEIEQKLLAMYVRAGFIAHYIDNDFECCDAVL